MVTIVTPKGIISLRASQVLLMLQSTQPEGQRTDAPAKKILIWRPKGG